MSGLFSFFGNYVSWKCRAKGPQFECIIVVLCKFDWLLFDWVPNNTQLMRRGEQKHIQIPLTQQSIVASYAWDCFARCSSLIMCAMNLFPARRSLFFGFVSCPVFGNKAPSIILPSACDVLAGFVIEFFMRRVDTGRLFVFTWSLMFSGLRVTIVLLIRSLLRLPTMV